MCQQATLTLLPATKPLPPASSQRNKEDPGHYTASQIPSTNYPQYYEGHQVFVIQST